ncbi:transposase [bacterium]|nr:transposase [bacterium]
MYKAVMRDKYADSPVWRCRGYLPHFDQPGAVQFITYRTADSLPKEAVLKIHQQIPAHMSAERREALEALLDRCHGACLLRRPEVAAVVQENLFHFDADRYRLLAWCVMPNHVHILIEVLNGYTLDKIMHGCKHNTATRINRVLGRSGPFWLEDYFDRCVRDEEHLNRTIEYIERNPVSAGLCSRIEEWEFSSKLCVRKD